MLKKNLRTIFAGLLIVAVFILSSLYAIPSQAFGLGTIAGKDYKLGLDLQGGAHLVYEADMSAIPADDRSQALQGVRDVIERRVNAFGIAEPIVQTNISGDSYRIIVELAGVFDISEAIDLIGETPILEFKIPKEVVETDLTKEQQAQMDNAQEEEFDAAEEVLARARSGEDFAELAKEFSIDSRTANKGGDLGLVEATDSTFDGLIEEIESNNTQPGIIRGLYESTSSLHIVRLNAIESAEEVQMSHILICHNESVQGCDRPFNKDEARQYLEDLKRNITTISFPDIAQEESDDRGSGANGGSLGWVRQGDMVQPFEEAYLALADGRISDIVETDFGFHLIYREDSRPVNSYDLSHIEMPLTTASDIIDVDPWENTGLSGKQLKSSSVAFDQNSSANTPFVVLEFDSEGAKLFEDLTEEQVGNIIGIFLDGQPISTPVVNQPIYGGEAQIVGNFTIQEARLLAQRLNAGALPVPVELLSQQTVGPALGAISLQKSIQAAGIGLIAVALFMVLFYRLSGFLAIIALLLYTALTLSIYRLFGVTITLAGIAGFILSIGMAVDANVLIFERMKEEIAAGRDLKTAVDEAVRRAWTSIRDGNFTTILAAIILFAFSTSFIKGFALMLGIGILISMLTAILVTRYLLKIAVAIPQLRKPWLYNAKKK